MNVFGTWVRERVTLRSVLSGLTAVLIVLAFALCWGVVWIWTSWTESLSWLLWWTVVTPVVFLTAYLRSDRGANAGILVPAVVVGVAALFWAVGGFSYQEWGNVRGPTSELSILPWVFGFALVSAPLAYGGTRMHPKLLTALAAVLIGQALFVALTIVFPDPRVIEDGIYSKDNIATADRILIVILGGIGALLLVSAGTLLRRHISPWVTWPGAVMFFLTAVIYQTWYPPFSTFGD